MRFGIALAQTHTAVWADAAVLADGLGFESVWLPDHLVFPLDMAGTPYAEGGHPPVPPETPLFDCPAYLGYLAALTSEIRIGTFVYVYGLRHPLVAARGFATVDILADGRLEVGVGAGWLKGEWDAAGLDFATRGRRLDEAMAVSRRLWSEDVVAHDGRFWSWEPLRFDPKPAQPGGPPLLVGGESRAALRRAATLGDGWMSMPHDSLATLNLQLHLLRSFREDAGRADAPFSVTACVTTPPPVGEVERWVEAGIDRLIVRPWTRTRETLDGLRRFADDYAAVMSR